MTRSRVDLGVDVADLLVCPLAGQIGSFMPTTVPSFHTGGVS